MKNFSLLVIIFIFSIQTIYPQNQQENLEKYWRYRQRLRDNFMVVSPDVELYGMNIPAVDLYLNSNKTKNLFHGVMQIVI
jgi:hypothetical protein